MARATGFEAQKEALGETATALVAVANAVSEGHITVVPEVLVTGGGGSFEGLAATLMRTFGGGTATASGNGGDGLGMPQPQATVDAPTPEAGSPTPRSSRGGAEASPFARRA